MNQRPTAFRRAGRTVAATFIALALGVVLTIFLIRTADISAQSIVGILVGADPWFFAALIACTAVYVLCGSEKWRLVDHTLRGEGQQPVSRKSAFALSAIGMAIGYLFPMQIGPALARTAGMYVTREKPIVRGTVGTLIEQIFDLLIVVVIAPASFLALAFGLGPGPWVAIAGASLVLAIVLVGRIVDVVTSWSLRPVRRTGILERLRATVVEMERRGLLTSRIVRLLCALSVVRFALLVAMADLTTRAIGSTVPVWHLAGAMPFAVLATALAPTPAGLGINEWTYSSLLLAFGTPLSVAAEWSVANRFLVMAASGLIGIGWAAYVLASPDPRSRSSA